ncbi:GNAT family N-acetyltransferase [Streptomyces mirabilis]|uniref:GNAT family N-acetyltransferase n=1 Tax=Streptomyces mirabilis TaxID=68239 RepID=UPI0033A77760
MALDLPGTQRTVEGFLSDSLESWRDVQGEADDVLDAESGAPLGSPPLASALLVEDEAGDIVGLAAYSFLWPSAGSTHSLFLKELYVRDTLRRQGVGARLMDELRAVASARPGCSRVEWMTDRDNPGARAFYKSLGFAEFDGKIVYRVFTSSA